MSFACKLIGHAWDDGVQDEPTERDKQLMVAAMKLAGVTSIVWSAGLWTYTCKRCGAKDRR